MWQLTFQVRSDEVPEWLLRFFCYLCGAKVAGTAELTMPSWLRALEGGELVEIGSNTFLGGSNWAFRALCNLRALCHFDLFSV